MGEHLAKKLQEEIIAHAKAVAAQHRQKPTSAKRAEMGAIPTPTRKAAKRSDSRVEAAATEAKPAATRARQLIGATFFHAEEANHLASLFIVL